MSSLSDAACLKRKHWTVIATAHLVVFRVMDGFQAAPDGVGSVKVGYMHYLACSDVLSDEDLCVYIVWDPDLGLIRINGCIGTWESAIDIWSNVVEHEYTADAFVPDNPIGVIQLVF